MQDNSGYKSSYKLFISFLRKVLKENSFPESFTEERIRSITREEFLLMMRNASLTTDAASPKTIQVKDEKVFIPFDNWRKDKETLHKFYYQFTRFGYLQHCKDDLYKPLPIPSESQAVKYIWLRSSTELMYAFDKLIYRYSAIPLLPDLYESLSDSFLLRKKSSGELKSPNPESLEKLHSRIRTSKLVYKDIDERLICAFSDKNVE